MAVLATYGGMWLDATCFPTARMQDIYPILVKGSGFFVFKKSPDGSISNWFLVAERGNYMAQLMHQTLLLYWKIYDRPLFYFFFHAIFRELVQVDREFMDGWERMSEPRVNPRAVAHALLKERSPEKLNALFAGSFVHKLTHKHKPDQISATCVETMIVGGYSPPAVAHASRLSR